MKKEREGEIDRKREKEREKEREREGGVTIPHCQSPASSFSRFSWQSPGNVSI